MKLHKMPLLLASSSEPQLSVVLPQAKQVLLYLSGASCHAQLNYVINLVFLRHKFLTVTLIFCFNVATSKCQH